MLTLQGQGDPQVTIPHEMTKRRLSGNQTMFKTVTVRTCADTGVLKTFLSHQRTSEGLTDLPQEAIGPSRGVCTSFSK